MRVFKRYLTAVGLVAFVVFLVGCGGSSDSSTNPPPTSPVVEDEEIPQTPKHGAGDEVQNIEEPGEASW